MIYGVQALRGIASIAVILTHCFLYMLSIPEISQKVSNSIFYSFRYIGAFGVDIFFVISGFIIFFIADKDYNKSSPNKFLLNRFYRVYPIYWVVFLLYVGLALVFGKVFGFEQLIYSFLLIPYFENNNFNMVVGVAWTLTYEIYFYLLVYFLLLINKFHFKYLVIFLFMITMMANIFVEGNVKLFFGNTIVFEFILGAFVFVIFKNNKCEKLCLIFSMILMLITLLFAINVYEGFENKFEMYRFIYLGFPAFFLVLSIVFLEKHFFYKVKNNFSEKIRYVFSYVGEISYLLYLIHFTLIIPVIGKIFSQFKIWNNVEWYFIFWFFMIFIFMSTVLFYKVVELPIKSFISKIGK